MILDLVEHVSPLGGPPVDVHVADGLISALIPSRREGAPRLLLPGLVEGHCHLDKTLWGQPWWRNEVGPSLMDRINNEKATRRAIGMDAAR